MPPTPAWNEAGSRPGAGECLSPTLRKVMRSSRSMARSGLGHQRAAALVHRAERLVARDDLGDVVEVPVAFWFGGFARAHEIHVVHHAPDMYLMRSRKPSEPKGDWDLYDIAKIIPGDQAFRPMDKGGCPLVSKP